MAAREPIQFNNWNSIIEELTGNRDIVERIFLMSTDDDRVRFCFNNEIILTAIERWLIDAEGVSSVNWLFGKSDGVCDKFRCEGNELFGEKRYEEAAELYTKSLLRNSKQNSRKFALCYSNRSAAFYYLKKYQTCLDDIERAFEFDCSGGMRFKLYARKARCCYELGRYDECVEVADLAFTCSEDQWLVSSSKFVERVKAELKELIEKASEQLPLNLLNLNLCEDLDNFPAISYGENAMIASASAAICLAFKPAQGRHLVAKRNIKAGDILFVEKPFASVLLPQFNDSLCHHCYRFVEAAIPCEQCSTVRFCSYKCRQSSFSEYHHIECKWLPLLYQMGILHLVIRIVMKAGISHLLEKRTVLKYIENCTDAFQFSKDEPFRNYEAVYSLVTNAEKIKPKDMVYYVMSAVLFTKLFEPEITKHSNEESAKYFIGCVIMRHIQQLICNANAITGLMTSTSSSGSSVKDEMQERIATSVYPSASLMNHSCDPNIISSYIDDVLVVRAASDILTGDEIYNCYGPHYLRMSKIERHKALLSQYYFSCNCPRCNEEVDKMIQFKAFKCKDCNGPVLENKKCAHCQRIDENYTVLTSQLIQSVTLFNECLTLYEDNRLQDSLDLVKKCLCIQRAILFKFHPHLLSSIDMAARICADLGMYNECLRFLGETLKITEDVYGSKSIELANELQKYTDVLGKQITTSAIRNKRDVIALKPKFKEVMAALEKGLTIFKTLYGEMHDATKQMTAKKRNICEIEKGIEVIERQMN